MNNQEALYYIATSMLPRIGPIVAKQLIAYIGSPEQIFKESRKSLQRIPNIGNILSKAITEQNILQNAEIELEYVIKNNILLTNYTESTYPQRLKHCEDSPLLLYYKGNVDFNSEKIISIVGTRNATEYGKQLCEKFIKDIAHHNPTIVSGLAFGIDITAHKAAITQSLPTIAVVGNGFHSITPSEHLKYLEKIESNGAVVTESHSQTMYDNALFVKRNRIIAGIADATIMVESKIKGGALITVDFANQYDRDVCTFPGNIGNPTAAGSNMLIKEYKAHLIENAQDFQKILNWDNTSKTKPARQKELFIQLSNTEKSILIVLEKGECTIDFIASECKIPMNTTSSTLLEMEFKGVIKSLPGKRFCKV